ncbi:MAG: peptide deformylase [Candidatus Saccharimonadales bacterium]
MADYELLKATDVRLNNISRELGTDEISSDFLQDVTTSMQTVALNERDKDNPGRRTLVGLAAPQIGAFVRVILFDQNASAGEPNFDPDIRFMINPQIEKSSQQESLGREGCYSSGEICGAVHRANSAIVCGLDLNGKTACYDLKDFQARIVQHEIDHLNGIRFPDRVRKPEHLHRVGEDEFQAYREHWQTWKKQYPFEGWLIMKNGSAK